MRRLVSVIFCLFWATMAHATPDANRRVALVIGNGDYAHSLPLPNPGNDARKVEQALKRLDFEVHLGLDLDQTAMQEIIIRFSRSARGADVALFYYAGHAMQFEGVNYLLPVDARLTDEADLRRLVRVDDLMRDLQAARNLRILVLDACRDNPLAQQLQRSLGATRGAASMAPGLARIDSREGLVISFATQPGRTADDGAGENSPYTEAFLAHIETPYEIGTVFRRISADVHAATGGRQWPELSLSLIDDFFLAGRGEPADQQAEFTERTVAARAWEEVGQSQDTQVIEAFLAEYPTGLYATLARRRLEEMRQSSTASGDRSQADGRFPFAAMLTRQTEMFSSPSPLSSSVRRLAVGEMLHVLARSSDAAMWYRVRDGAGNEGFVRRDQVRELD